MSYQYGNPVKEVIEVPEKEQRFVTEVQDSWIFLVFQTWDKGTLSWATDYATRITYAESGGIVLEIQNAAAKVFARDFPSDGSTVFHR